MYRNFPHTVSEWNDLTSDQVSVMNLEHSYDINVILLLDFVDTCE